MSFKKVIWAVDLQHYSQKKDALEYASQVLKILDKDNSLDIEAVSVQPFLYNIWHELTLQGPAELTPAKARADYYKLLDAKLGELIGSLGPKFKAKHKVIPLKEVSLSQSIKELVKYAQKEKADLIVLCSKNKKGLARFLLGSFAESMIFTSKIPLLVLNPTMEPIKNIKNILFPTDFREKTDVFFERVLELAKVTKAKITLLHFFTEGISKHSPDYIKDKLAKDQEWAKKLQTQAQKNKVKMEIHIQTEPMSDSKVADEITKLAARKNAQLVAMMGRLSKFESLTIGGHVVKVVRGVHCPVYIMHL